MILMYCMSLFDTPNDSMMDIPFNVTRETSFDTMMKIVNHALALDLLDIPLTQQIIDWLKEKEIAILSTMFPIENRTLFFKGFMRAYNTYGTCKLFYSKPWMGEIRLSKHLKLPNNAEGIVNILAHEVLHGILPYEECHSHNFVNAMKQLNQELPVHIQVTGIHGLVELPKIKYELYCPCCGHVFRKYIKKTKIVDNPERYICSKCKEDLKIRTL